MSQCMPHYFIDSPSMIKEADIKIEDEGDMTCGSDPSQPFNHMIKIIDVPKKKKTCANAVRERTRVHQLKQAFVELQNALPNVPAGTKLSKLDILILASNYISLLMSKLSDEDPGEHYNNLKEKGRLYPIKVNTFVIVSPFLLPI